MELFSQSLVMCKAVEILSVNVYLAKWMYNFGCSGVLSD